MSLGHAAASDTTSRTSSVPTLRTMIFAPGLILCDYGKGKLAWLPWDIGAL
jgi:hypothetical protein